MRNGRTPPSLGGTPKAPGRAQNEDAGAVQDKQALFRNSIGYQVRKTHRMTENFLQDQLAPHDIPVGMWYFLRTLWAEEGLTQRELSRRVGATEPTTLEQLRNMEERGLVERRRDEEDRRKTCVFLTRMGRDLKKRLLPFVDDLNATAFDGFSEQEVRQLQELLHRVRENLRSAKSLR